MWPAVLLCYRWDGFALASFCDGERERELLRPADGGCDGGLLGGNFTEWKCRLV